MAAWYVYIVRCRDGSLYTGISPDVTARVAAHNDGRGARYTRSRRPVTLLHTERKRDRSSALRREAALKALSRLEKLALLAAREAGASTRSARARDKAATPPRAAPAAAKTPRRRSQS